MVQLDQLGSYVYALVDPYQNDKIFYVGMAGPKFDNRTNMRPTEHFSFLGKREPVSEKEVYIQRMIDSGKKPEELIHIIRHHLRDPKEAFTVEAALIDAFGKDNLTNMKKGNDSVNSRMSWSELDIRFGTKYVEWEELQSFARTQGIRITLLHIKDNYRPNLKPYELYEATRGYWKIGKHKAAMDKPTIAIACVGDAILEAYRVVMWLPFGEVFSSRYDDATLEKIKGKAVLSEKALIKKEFVGQLAKNSDFPYRRFRIKKDRELLKWPENPVKHIE